MDTNLDINWFLEKALPLSNWDIEYKRELYGPNSTTIPVNSIWTIACREIINPFYAIQIASVILWMFEKYYYYAICILIISVISIAVSTYETRKQQQSLHEMSSHSSKVKVIRSEFERVQREGQKVEDRKGSMAKKSFDDLDVQATRKINSRLIFHL